MQIHNAAVTGSFTYNGIDISDITGSEQSVVSLNEFSASILNYTSSNNQSVATLQGATASLQGATSSLFAYTASNSANVASLFATSASLNAAVADIRNATSSLYFATASIYGATSSLFNYSASSNLRIGSLEQYTASLNTRSASFACVDATNTFACAQYFSNTSNAISFSSTGSLYSDGGMRITKDLYVSGTSYFNNVTVFGTQSINYITSSQLNIASNLITVNTSTPAVRFGGLAVYDSGSLGTGLTGSILWDSEANHWVYSNPSGSTYSGGMFISGPRSAALGSEQGTTACALMKGQGGDHITSSGVFEIGGCVGVGTSNICSNLQVKSTGNYIWSTGNGYGDFYVGDGTYGLSLGTAVGGGGAGDTRMWTKGGTHTFYIGTSNVDAIKIDASQNVCIAGNLYGCSSLLANNNIRVGTGTSAGNATDPAITTGGCTKAGVYFDGSCVALGSGGNTLILTQTGKVGIGTSQPDYGNLSIVCTDNTVLSSALWGTSTAAGVVAAVYNTSQCANSVAGLRLITRNSGASVWNIYNVSVGGDNGDLAFGNGAGGSGAEKLRIFNSGITCFACAVCIGGEMIVKGNAGACNTHYFTTGAANVAKYIQYNATGTAINQIAADAHSYFNSGCNVGINCNSPSYKLHVGGNIAGYFAADGDNIATFINNASSYLYGAGGVFIGSSTAHNCTNLAGGSGALIIRNGASTYTAAIAYNGQAYFCNCVGIGVSSPEQLLHVSNGYIQVGIDKGIKFVTSGASGRPELSIDSNATLNFKNTAGIINIAIDNSGNMGIGISPRNGDGKLQMALGTAITWGNANSAGADYSWISDGSYNFSSGNALVINTEKARPVVIGTCGTARFCVGANGISTFACQVCAPRITIPILRISDETTFGLTACKGPNSYPIFHADGAQGIGFLTAESSTFGERLRIFHTGQACFACRPQFPGATLLCSYTCTFSSYTAGTWVGLFAGDNGFNGAYAFTVVGQFNLNGSPLYSMNYATVPYIHKSDLIGSTNGNAFTTLQYNQSGHADNGVAVAFRRAMYTSNTPVGNRTEFCMSSNYNTTFTATTYVLAWV